VTLTGEVIAKNYNRVVLLDGENRLWSVRFLKNAKVYPGDRLTVEGRAYGGRVYAERWKVERSLLQRWRLKVRSVLKERFLQTAETKIQKKVGSALLFGENWFSRREREKIAHLGIYHLIVISGMHYALFLTAFFFLPVRWGLRYWVALAFFTFFTFFILFPKAPAYRAFVSVALFMVARLLLRNYDPLKALFLSAALWLALFPHWGTNVGFWLSYLASLALILYYGGRKTPEEDFVRSVFGKTFGLEASVVVSAVINPLIAYFFKYLSFGVFLFGFLFTVLVQFFVVVGTFNLLTFWTLPPLVWLQNALAEAFGYLLKVLPESVYFEVSPFPFLFVLVFVSAALLLLALPLRNKFWWTFGLLLVETAFFLTHGRE